MTAARKKHLSFIIGGIISVALMWALFRNIDVVRLWAVLKEANYYWLIPNVILIVVAMYQRAYRWGFMIQPVKHVAYPNLLAATCIGFMANNVLPLRLGELVRAYSLSYQDKDVSKTASLATIFVERIVFDLVALLFIFGAVISVTEVNITEKMKFGMYLSIAAALIGLVFALLLAGKPNQAGHFITRYLFFLPDRFKETIRVIIIKFSGGLQFFKKPKIVSWVGLQTLAIWFSMGISNYFVFLAFGFDLPLNASFMLLVIVSVSIMVPSSPGFIGVYHAGIVFTLSQYGIAREDALSFALVIHAAQYIPITLMGFYFLKKEHLSLSQLEEEAVDPVDD